MLTLIFKNGSKRVTNLHPSFFANVKGEDSPNKKAHQIMLDEGAIKYILEPIRK